MAGTIYQLKIQLNGIGPPIWRRILVSPRTDLVQLHTIIQIAMGWTDSHLHQFVVGRKRYCEPDPDFPDDSMPEAGVAIGSLLKKAKQWLTYEYDFGDGWEHRVTLEAILPARNGVSVPRCIAGRRACPPEDVGGIEGYKSVHTLIVAGTPLWVAADDIQCPSDGDPRTEDECFRTGME